MKSFIRPFTLRHQQLKELRYNLYVYSKNEGSGVVIQDINDKCITLIVKNTDSVYRYELNACIEGIKWILDKYENNKELQKHVQIKLYSNSVYCVNFIKEWMAIWKETNFENRPNKDLLQKLQEQINKCTINSNWVHDKYNDIYQSLIKQI